MRTSTPEDLGLLLFGRIRSAILALLLGHPDESYHTRHIARLINSSVGTTQRELRRLADAGFLDRRTQGHQVLYQANRQSPVFGELRGLLLKTIGAAGLLASALRPLAATIDAAFIYGSIARGGEHAPSDVDVMVIGDVSFAELAGALAPLQQDLGRDVNPTLYRPQEFAERVAAGHHFLTSVLAAPKVFIIGDDRELRRMAQQRVAQTPPDKRPGNRGSRRRRHT